MSQVPESSKTLLSFPQTAVCQVVVYSNPSCSIMFVVASLSTPYQLNLNLWTKNSNTPKIPGLAETGIGGEDTRLRRLEGLGLRNAGGKRENVYKCAIQGSFKNHVLAVS